MSDERVFFRTDEEFLAWLNKKSRGATTDTERRQVARIALEASLDTDHCGVCAERFFLRRAVVDAQPLTFRRVCPACAATLPGNAAAFRLHYTGEIWLQTYRAHDRTLHYHRFRPESMEHLLSFVDFCLTRFHCFEYWKDIKDVGPIRYSNVILQIQRLERTGMLFWAAHSEIDEGIGFVSDLSSPRVQQILEIIRKGGKE